LAFHADPTPGVPARSTIRAIFPTLNGWKVRIFVEGIPANGVTCSVDSEVYQDAALGGVLEDFMAGLMETAERDETARYTIVGRCCEIHKRKLGWRVSGLEGCSTTGQRTGGWQGLDASSNVFVMRAVAQAVQSPTMKQKLTPYSTRMVGAISERGWKRQFEEPIPLVTLEDAGKYIQKLPKAEQQIEEWQTAIEVLLLVAEHGGPTMMARIGVMRGPHGLTSNASLEAIPRSRLIQLNWRML
jgi:hypothetical protein